MSSIVRVSGAAFTLPLIALDETGSPRDLTSATAATFTAKVAAATRIAKTLGGGITIDSDPITGRLSVAVLSSDTATLTDGLLMWQCLVTIGADDFLVDSGTLELLTFPAAGALLEPADLYGSIDLALLTRLSMNAGDEGAPSAVVIAVCAADAADEMFSIIGHRYSRPVAFAGPSKGFLKRLTIYRLFMRYGGDLLTTRQAVRHPIELDYKQALQTLAMIAQGNGELSDLTERIASASAGDAYSAYVVAEDPVFDPPLANGNE